jgi:hypothetical protein
MAVNKASHEAPLFYHVICISKEIFIFELDSLLKKEKNRMSASSFLRGGPGERSGGVG